jgi:hypothetical protein
LIYARAYVYFDALPTSGARYQFLILRGTSDEWLGLNILPDRWRVWYYSGNWVYSDWVSTPPTDEWLCVEVKAYIHASAGEIRMYVNGVERITLTGIDTNDYGNITRVSIGQTIADSIVVEIYADCVVVADAYIGPESAGGEEYSFELSETANVTSSLSTQKNLYRTSSETVTVTSAVGTSKTMTKTAGEITDLTWSLETQKTLTRTTGESTSITTTFESVKSITAVVAELSETISVSASLLVQKAIHILATGTVELTAILDVAKHLHAILVSLLETLPFSGYLEALLPEIELTTEEVLAVCVALIVMFFSVAVGLVFMKRRKEA